MLKYVVLLVFLCEIKNGISSSASPEEQTLESSDLPKNGIKKNKVGANGLEVNWDKITRNFQNPVLEYLLQQNSDRMRGPPQRGVVREIRHSQTLLIPNFSGNSLPEFFASQLPQFGSVKKPKNTRVDAPKRGITLKINAKKKPAEELTRNPDKSPFENFWNFLKNKTRPGGSEIQESVVSSPVLHLNKNPVETKELLPVLQMYPAVAVVINTFDKDGSLKNSVTHFQPDFSLLRPTVNDKNAEASEEKNVNKNHKNIYNSQYTVTNYEKDGQNSFFGGSGHLQESRQGISWPFASYFPIVINDPFLSVYNAFATSMYNAVTSMIEYGPEADICLKNKINESEKINSNVQRTDLNNHKVLPHFDRYQMKTSEPKEDIFDEVITRSETFKRIKGKSVINQKEDSPGLDSFGRQRRDTTSIFVKSKEGDTVDITLEGPDGSDDTTVNLPDERARSFSNVLVNTPPLSTILKPPQQESRQFLGYADKKRKTKPSKPYKEEGNSEEIGEEHEEESTSQSQESANEAVAISPPPEGASVAEAKPIGLAIAGPGGVAASKPQGTAVAGPGGLAIARPVGTAIAGVDVEGSVPIGGQQKNKKKPKQEQEQTETELHYVGGLTGPIGNPQPKEFADSIYYRTVKETEGNNVQDNLFFRGGSSSKTFQLHLGQQNGKYGFIPVSGNPIEGGAKLQKRTDFPTFFHGLLGNNAQEYEQFPNYQTQF